MAMHIQVRRGLEADWAAANPILAEGEICAELDTGRFKLGDGIRHWNDIDYSTGIQGPQGIQGIPGETYVLPDASDTVLGGVKIGTNVNIDIDGTISVPFGAGINTIKDIPDVYTTSPSIDNGSMLVYNAGASRWDVTPTLASQNMDGGEF